MKRLFAILCCFLTLLAGCSGEPTPESSAPVETITESSALPSESATAAPTTAAPETEFIFPDPTLSPEDQERLDFYNLFWELDPEATDRWLAGNPEYFENSYKGLSVNKAGLSDDGLELYTTQGHQVLAIDAVTGVLIVRVWLAGSRGVLAIAKDPGRVHLFPAEDLGSHGERIDSIARRNNGVLAMTGSGFLDENGAGNGGQMTGSCRCSGEDYGTPYGWNCARFSLMEDNYVVIGHADGPFPKNARDGMEFDPALIIDGELQDPKYWIEKNPRTCIGQNKRGNILMLGVEGRYADSPGCSVEECAKLLQEYEGWNAINVDGGTTAIVWYQGEPIMRCSNQATPEGRYLPNAWVYVNP